MIYKLISMLLLAVLAPASHAAHAARVDERKLVDGVEIRDIKFEKGRFADGNGYIEGYSGNTVAFTQRIGKGDFTIKATLWLRDLNGSYPFFRLDDNYFCFDSAAASLHVNGSKFGGPAVKKIGEASKFITKSQTFAFEIRRRNGKVQIFLSNQPVYAADYGDGPIDYAGFGVGNNVLRIHSWSIAANIEEVAPVEAPKGPSASEFQNRVDNAIDRGIKYLLNYQCRDGSWGYHAYFFPAGETALCAYTLLKCGIPASHPALQRAFAYLDGIEPAETYVVSCMLSAYEATGNPAYKAKIQQLSGILTGYNERGLWSYPNSWGSPWRAEKGLIDLSNTQFAVLGLRAAHKGGVDIPAALWKQIIESALKFQEIPRIMDASGSPKTDGTTTTGKIQVAGFSYRAGEGAYGSMTAAGICILKIALENVKSSLSSAQVRTVQNAIDSGVNWLAENFTITSNPKKGDWVYYYLYGLERVGAFLKIDKIGEHDWYREGADWLISKQGNDGAWAESDHAEADTCFALLFLRRASAPIITGNDTLPPKDVYISESPTNDLSMRASGRNRLKIWISGFGENAKKQYGGGNIGGLRIAKIEYFIDGKTAGEIQGNPAKAWVDEKYAFEHEFTTTGKHKVSARAHLVEPGAADDDKNPTVYLYSTGFELNVESVLAGWMLAAARARARNVMLNIGKTVNASSSANGGETPPRAADGLESSRWLFAANDARPTLTIELQNSIKANTLVFTQAFNKPASGGLFDKITQVEIVINNNKPFKADLDADDAKPTAVSLGRVFTITRIEVRVVARVKNASQPGIGGFSEVTLEMRKQ
ncbi:MAG: hypothetical protein HY286_10395 [Planctomycetes bacterium]|nr:hypothetical protein [Planctomycetota bacterium]